MDDSYVAGLVDADGSIIISKIRVTKRAFDNPSYRLTVQVTNTYRPVLEMLVRRYGGHICDKQLSVGSFFTRKLHYNWSIGSNLAYKFLKVIQPHLIIKKEQANLGIDFWESRTPYATSGGHRLSIEEISLRDKFHLGMKKLNGTV